MSREEKQILVYEAALKLFAKFGYRKTTVEDIGNELGMTKGNLYLYTKNKKDLYESSIAYALKKWQKDAYEYAEKEDDIIKKIYSYCLRGYQYLQTNTDLETLIINDSGIFPMSPGDDRFYAINLESMGILKNMLLQGIQEGVFREVDTESISELLYSIYVMLVIKTYIKSDNKLNPVILESGFDLILNGLKKNSKAGVI